MDSSVIPSGITATGTIWIGAWRIDFAKESLAEWRNLIKRHLRKLKTAAEINLPSLSKARLKGLIKEAVVDAYTEEEQIVGFLTMIEEHLALPFSVKMLGVEAEVEKVDLTLDSQIVAICRRGDTRQKVPILDLPLPVPAPAGAEWIAAYRRWRRGSW